MTDAPAAVAPRRRPEQARSRERVEQVLEAAQHLIAERGTEPVTMTDIAERAGMAVTALYRYFPNKQSVVRELAVRLFERDQQSLILPILSRDADVEDLIRDGIAAYWQRHREEPFRLSLRTAILADAELAALDFRDTRGNAAFLAGRVAELTGRTDLDELTERMLLLLSLLDGLIRTASETGEDEAARLVEHFTTMMIDQFTSPP